MSEKERDHLKTDPRRQGSLYPLPWTRENQPEFFRQLDEMRNPPALPVQPVSADVPDVSPNLAQALKAAKPDAQPLKELRIQSDDDFCSQLPIGGSLCKRVAGLFR